MAAAPGGPIDTADEPGIPVEGKHSTTMASHGGPRIGEPMLEKEQRISLKGVDTLIVGVSWDVSEGRAHDTDLDASCVAFDREGQFDSSIYFGNLTNDNHSITHSGDNRTGDGDGDDEEIIIKLSAVPFTIRALVITVTSYSGATFETVTNASLRITSDDSKSRTAARPLGRYPLSGASSKSSGVIMAKVYRDADQPSEWHFHAIGLDVDGRSFGDLLPSMQTTLRDIIPKVKVVDNHNVIVLAKGEAVALEPKDRNGTLDTIEVGLGWDTDAGKAIDLDSSCVLFDARHNVIDTVYFSKLSNSNGSVVHSGDNVTGEGAGDDEKIRVELKKLPKEVKALYFVVNSYSGEPFSQVRNAYVRLVNSSTKRELIRFHLSGAGNPAHTAVIMCKLYLDKTHDPKGKWMLRALGFGTRGSMARDNIADMQKDLAGRLKLSDSTCFKYDPKNAHAQITSSSSSSSSSSVTTTKPGGLTTTQLIMAIILVIFLVLMFQSNKGHHGGSSYTSKGRR